jgi:hypothetical protein
MSQFKFYINPNRVSRKTFTSKRSRAMDRQLQSELLVAAGEEVSTSEIAFRLLSETQLVLVGGGIGDTVL